MPTAAPLRARHLTVVRGPLTVLDDVDLVVGVGQRIGVVGPNGVGKSTLLQALGGPGAARPRPCRSHAADGDRRLPAAGSQSVRQRNGRGRTSARRTGVAAAAGEMESATHALAAGAAGADDRYAHALERWMALGGADLDARVGQVWAELGLDHVLLDQPT